MTSVSLSIQHRLELDSVKPSFDVLAQTGFRRSYLGRKSSPSEALLVATGRGRKPSRRHSYIEPHLVHHHLETKEHAPSHEERTVRFIEQEPVHRHLEPSHSSTWYYTEPSSYSFRQSSVPPVRRIVAQPEGSRALSEYRDTLGTASPSHHVHQQQRWSVYGAAPASDWRRAQSTPPDFYRRSTARLPIIGDRLTRRRNHEFAIGVKLAESQSDLDTFNRMLDKRFGGNVGYTSNYGVYPSYRSTYYTSPLFYDYPVCVGPTVGL